MNHFDPQLVDTAKYAKPPKWHLCFSNAGLGNPWRVAGMTTMKAEVKLHPEIGDFTVVDAESKDDKQISDLADLQTKGCSALIVSPNTTAALTPAVEKFCQSGVPVVVHAACLYGPERSWLLVASAPVADWPGLEAEVARLMDGFRPG